MKKKTKIYVFVFSLLITLSCSSILFAGQVKFVAKSNSSSKIVSGRVSFKPELKQLKQLLRDLKEIRQELNKLKHDLEFIRDRLNQLDQKISDLHQEIIALQKKMSGSN